MDRLVCVLSLFYPSFQFFSLSKQSPSIYTNPRSQFNIIPYSKPLSLTVKMDQTLASLSTKLASTVGGLMIIWSMFRQFLPYELKHHFLNLTMKLQAYISPYDTFIIEEYTGERMSKHELYTASKAFLSDHCSKKARTCRIELGKDSDRFLVTVGDWMEVTDDFQGAKIWWHAHKHETNSNQSNSRIVDEERRYYQLTFHKRHREILEKDYLKHVLETGRSITIRNRQRRLFTNSPTMDWFSFKKSVWSHVPFQHPSTFKTLAMDPVKKQEIVDDLTEFRKGKEYYSRIGKAWKRGYLLYGPPGTGKSSMISAIANFMEYDIYDLELTTVKSNSDLRKLFIETTGKSIIVIEDIDCSLDLTGRRKDKKKENDQEENGEKKKVSRSEEDPESTKVTLSGLLNFIDGLWSACGEERILIFTTNHVEKLDPALIRTGRMDKHIEMSYCDFESFKVLAMNYLDIYNHSLFGEIEGFLEEVEITPADVAEHLMCVSSAKKDVDACLKKLIRVLEAKREEMESKETNSSLENGSVQNVNNIENGNNVENGNVAKANNLENGNVENGI
ncbi:hypothetical protein LUZ60_005186 [Juncus effusus]|nr:hypothetical protein LUZ60_005186 [Juncus effusus]